jgi:hypothetical protein
MLSAPAIMGDICTVQSVPRFSHLFSMHVSYDQ